MEETTRKQRLFAGWVAIAFGMLVLIVMVRNPESFLVPAWVAYAAMSTFVSGGCALLLGEYEATRKWVVLAGFLTVIGLMVPALWVAFSPGPATCSVWLPFGGAEASDWICRGGFGLFAALCLVYLVFLGLRFWHKRSLD